MAHTLNDEEGYGEEWSPESCDLFSAREMLQELAEIIEKYNLVKSLDKGTIIYRARVPGSKKHLGKPLALGPPPINSALKPNRMSPAGIPMFYGSEQSNTAVLETATTRSRATIGEFKLRKPIHIIDFVNLPQADESNLPEARGFFSVGEPSGHKHDTRVPPDETHFLHQLVSDISQPVTDEERQIIDYVPTQVITEFIRRSFLHEGKHVEGIAYPSALPEVRGKRNFVLFADQTNVHLTDEQRERLSEKQKKALPFFSNDCWLELVDSFMKEVQMKVV